MFGKKTAKETVQPWTVHRLDVRGRDAVVAFHGPSREGMPTSELGPELDKIVTEFIASPIVAKYNASREALVKAEEQQYAAGMDRVRAEHIAAESLENSALESCTQAVTTHESAKRRTELLRDTCDANWATLNREFQQLFDRRRGEMLSQATAAINDKQAKLAQLASPILDELGRLLDLRRRLMPVSFKNVALGLTPPPAKPSVETLTEDLFTETPFPTRT